MYKSQGGSSSRVWEDKTPTTFIPAFNAADTPEKESSNTTQSSGATPRFFADLRYTSGSGLCSRTSSLARTDSILDLNPTDSIINSRLDLGAEVATPVLNPDFLRLSRKGKNPPMGSISSA